MQNKLVGALRIEYNTLLKVADGLLDAICANAACNVLTFSKMASEARAAAHRIASEIERLIFELHATPKKESRTVRDTVVGFFSKIASAFRNELDLLIA